MISLGIESTAHTIGVGLATENKILSNIKLTYKPNSGGIHPREASEFIAKNAPRVLEQAINKAGIKKEEIDIISYSRAPGIGHSLRVGLTIAKTISNKLNKPLIGVNHCIAHVEIARKLTGLKDPVVLYTSGANTQVITFGEGRYRLMAETLDMGLGNFIDSFARLAGIPFPGGPVIEELAKKGRYIELPYVIKGMDVSFTGILTNLKNKLGKHKLEDLCYSLQETVFAMLVEATERAMAHTQKKELTITGGVASNQRLREMCETMTKDRGAVFKVPPKEYCVDNGAMIALTGLLMHESGAKIKEGVSQAERTDEVEVTWR